MKKKSALTIEIVKLIVDCIVLPLYFVKFFHEVAVLPGFSDEGEQITNRIDYYYSIFDKISREGLSALLWISVVITVASVALCVANLIVKGNKSLKVVSNVVFAIAIVLFFVLLLISAGIRYSY